MPPRTEEERRELVEGSVQRFLSAIRDDMYPMECIEGLFGVQMDNGGVGSLVFNAWITLLRRGGATESGMCAALRGGRMPEYFEGLVRDLPADLQSHYTASLVQRNLFAGIVWDRPLLQAASFEPQETPERPSVRATRTRPPQQEGASARRRRLFGQAAAAEAEMAALLERAQPEHDGSLAGEDALRYMYLKSFDGMVGQTFVIRHLTSERGIALNGKRAVCVGRERPPFPAKPRMHVRVDGEVGAIKLKAANLAKPGSFVEQPSTTRIDDALLQPLLRSLVAESAASDGGSRLDIAARREWLRARLDEGHVPACGCMDPMVPEGEADTFVAGLAAIAPCCCGDGTADLHRFAEGMKGDGRTCTICLLPVAPTDPALGLPCQHLFHVDCLQPWLAQHDDCPTCRARLPRLPGSTAPYSVLPDEQLRTRLKEWFISGMCERCQATHHEADPLMMVTGPDGETRLVPSSRMDTSAMPMAD